MMEIVIKIDEWKYKSICEGVEASKRGGVVGVAPTIYEAIYNGTPLPKGHGDLIDKDRLLDELEKTVKSVDDTNKHLLFWDRAVAHVHLSKPIIKADKEEESNADSN